MGEKESPSIKFDITISVCRYPSGDVLDASYKKLRKEGLILGWHEDNAKLENEEYLLYQGKIIRIIFVEKKSNITITHKEISPAIMEKIKKIHEATEIPVEKLESEYLEFLNDPFIKTDPQFKTDAEREEYASAILMTRWNTATWKTL